MFRPMSSTAPTAISDQRIRCARISTGAAGLSSRKYSGNRPQSRNAPRPKMIPVRCSDAFLRIWT
jgi:hypothetical protein